MKMILNHRIYKQISIHYEWDLIKKVKIVHLDCHRTRDIQ